MNDKYTAMRIVAAKIRGLSTEQLIEAFDLTEHNHDVDIPTVRGWIMDELEARNPAAFNNWVDAVPVVGSPKTFF